MFVFFYWPVSHVLFFHYGSSTIGEPLANHYPFLRTSSSVPPLLPVYSSVACSSSLGGIGSFASGIWDRYWFRARFISTAFGVRFQ